MDAPHFLYEKVEAQRDDEFWSRSPRLRNKEAEVKVI